MKLYSRKHHRNVERQVHFGVGHGVKTACGIVLFSRHVMVSIHSDNDGALITDDLERVTCKRCLATRDTRLRKLIAIERVIPGVFDHATLCGQQWLLAHALDINRETIDAQKLKISNGEKTVVLSNTTKPRDRIFILLGAMK